MTSLVLPLGDDPPPVVPGTNCPGMPPRKRLRVAVFVEHDIVYRHFFQSSAFQALAARHDMVVVVPERGPDNKRLSVDIAGRSPSLRVATLPLEKDRIFLWRQLFQISQLRWRPGQEWAMLRNVTRRMLGPRAAKTYSVLALPGIFQIVQSWTLRRLNRLPSAMGDFVIRFKPDVLIHPTVLDGYFINDVVAIGHDHRIPTVTIMNSWDNPSTKRTAVGRPDWLLVWGPQTRNHAIRFMGMAPERVVPFGAAQFDLYRKPPRIGRTAFCRRHDIDPARHVLLYAGSSKGSDEFAHLRMIEDAIDRGTLSNLAVIYRPHPWGRGGHRGERLLDYPWRHVCIEASMRAYLEEIRAGRKPIHLADYADTHDVLSSVDAVVSPLSTIILEAMLHGKPTLCFLPDEVAGSSLHQQAKLVHFEDLYASPIVLKAHGDAALIGSLAALLVRVGDPAFATRVRESCVEFVEPFARAYDERLADFVETVVCRQRDSLARARIRATEP